MTDRSGDLRLGTRAWSLDAASRQGAMKPIIRDRLRRRLSASKRVGRPCRLAAFGTAPGFDAAARLPGEVMAGGTTELHSWIRRADQPAFGIDCII